MLLAEVGRALSSNRVIFVLIGLAVTEDIRSPRN